MATTHIEQSARIHRLDPVVSARIAAGEVVERPASVIRELLDNAIDSGAMRIRIETTDGGRKLIRISDDGCGIKAADLRVAVEKHATSKIREVEDLSRVVSLGFRGEALHALATVARLRITSSDGSASGAKELCVEGGSELWFRDAAGVRGTTVEVSKLFFNTPARREFLKSGRSEGMAIRQEVLEKLLAWPDRAFEYHADGKRVYNTPAGDVRERIAGLYGAEIAETLLPVSAEGDGIQLTGFVAPAFKNAASRKDQFFILNGRPVATASLSHALRSAYGNLLPPGRQPIAFLYLTVDPHSVNVNIHPAKREVRFLDEQAVYALIRRALTRALSGASGFSPADTTFFHKPAAAATPESRENRFSFDPPVGQQSGESGTGRVATSLVRETPTDLPASRQHGLRVAAPYSQSAGRLVGRFAGLRIVGGLFDNYWFLEGDGVMLAVDQHAVHERVLYERYRAQYEAGGVTRQGLLIPLNLELTLGEVALLQTHGDALAEAGFGVEAFGPEDFALQEVPSLLKGDMQEALKETLTLLDGNLKKMEKPERLLATLACRSAVKQGDRIPETMLVDILNELDGLERPFACPHGRPAIVEIPEKEIAKWFHRT